jgi:DNA-binding response OmpR family regulator
VRTMIAVVDDEPDIVDLVSINLERAGFEVKGFADATAFLKFLERQKPALVILDLMLPDLDGFDICRYLKSDERLAGICIIMLTAKSGETDRVVGLELGADDYVTKPFSVRELVARVKAVLRRHAAKQTTKRIKVGGDLVIDTEKYEVTVGSKKIDLTSSEFRILVLLASKEGRVFTREQILDHLWGREKAVVDRTVDVHVRNIRDKLGKAAGHLKSVRGIGYKVDV